jgi:hypothetical protein
VNLSDLITDQTAAILPAPILWAAAQFASKDQAKAKPLLLNIQIQRNESGTVTIRSCNGHQGFRITLPAEYAYCNAAEIKVPAADWSKPGKLLTAAEWCHLKTDGTAAAVSFTGQIAELRSFNPDPYAAEFPRLDNVWPTEYPCEPGRIMAFNANYLAGFANVAAKLSPAALIKLETNKANTPAQLTAEYRETGATLEFLLMPVEIRNDGYCPSKEAKIERDRQRRADARELEAYRAAAATKLPTLQTVAA